MKTRLTATIVSLVAIAALAVALPALAVDSQNSSTSGRGAKAGIHASTTLMGSSTRPIPKVDNNNLASSTEKRVENSQKQGDNMIDQRIHSLNDLLTRIQGMNRISDSSQASIESSVQAQITLLTNLKAKIDNDTSTTSLKDDLQSITKVYRIHALIEPQAQITVAADRILNIADMLNTVVSKIQTRLTAGVTASTSAAVQTSLSDLIAKIADAKVKANAAITEISLLKPDNGDKTVFASNQAALKDAHSKIKVGQKDLKAAQKDIKDIIKVLIQDIKSLGNMGDQ